jgi:isopentenyl-diphosphate delta-isomerase
MLNESSIDATKRRLQFELGITEKDIYEIIPDFQYKVEKDGIIENEICPILIGFTNQEPLINKDEVSDVAWIKWNKFTEDISNNPNKYSEWCVLETEKLKINSQFLFLYKKSAS